MPTSLHFITALSLLTHWRLAWRATLRLTVLFLPALSTDQDRNRSHRCAVTAAGTDDHATCTLR